ncbi:hypothetical protein NOCA2480089 [metagenome]|uniref:Uncharacterized protein n=1 Tax=metagenome TaxID=256318 RepID=A0A2P2C7U6_9ZZZZ
MPEHNSVIQKAAFQVGPDGGDFGHSLASKPGICLRAAPSFG